MLQADAPWSTPLATNSLSTAPHDPYPGLLLALHQPSGFGPTLSSKNFRRNIGSKGGTMLLRCWYHLLTTCPLQHAWILWKWHSLDPQLCSHCPCPLWLSPLHGDSGSCMVQVRAGCSPKGLLDIPGPSGAVLPAGIPAASPAHTPGSTPEANLVTNLLTQSHTWWRTWP